MSELNGRPVLVAVAARVGKARLIDNVVVETQAVNPTRRHAVSPTPRADRRLRDQRASR